MASLITGERLAKALGEPGFIKNGVSGSLEGAKYDFRVSPLVLKSSFGTPVNIEKLPEDQRAAVRVEPGEVVFVRTIEHLDLPNNIIALLSPKRKLSHQGIIVLGGFSVDPRYKGPLFVGLYNFSSTPFPIQAGKKLIAAMFYELEGAEVADFPLPESNSEEGEFPEELVTLIRNYKPIEMKWVVDAVAETQKRLEALSLELHDDHSWKREFQEALDRQSKQIDKLLEGLQEEKQARKEEDATIKTRLEGMSSIFTSARIIWSLIWGIGVLVVGVLLGVFIPKLFDDAPQPQPPPPPAISGPASTSPPG